MEQIANFNINIFTSFFQRTTNGYLYIKKILIERLLIERLSICMIVALSIVNCPAQSIDSLLSHAYNHNPELKALQLEYEAALQKGPQVSQLPDPSIGMGVPVLRPETRLGGQVLSISASQMFPWFGTLKAKEDVVITMAKSKYEKITAVRLDLIFQIKNAYYNLYLIQKKQDILKKHIRIFEALEKVAIAKVESGKSIASDALAIQIKLEDIRNQISVLQHQKKTFNAQIIEATNGSIQDTILITDSLSTLTPPTLDIEAYRQKIRSYHPLMKQLDWQIEASNKELKLNELSVKPSLGVGLDYSMVNARSDAFPAHNGRDILIPKIMVGIPLQRGKYMAKKEEERLMQEAMELQKDQLTNKMISLIQSYQSEYQSALLLNELSKKQLSLSQSATEILLGEYSSKGTRFDELMRIQNDRINYELGIIMANYQCHLAQIKIDRLTDY